VISAGHRRSLLKGERPRQAGSMQGVGNFAILTSVRVPVCEDDDRQGSQISL